MTTTATQTGPRLTITGTCEGCCWLRIGVRDPRLGARLNAACVHPTRNDGGIIFAKSSKAPTMPTDCPDLPAARLALARGIVAEAEPLALPLPGDAPVNPKPATWDDGERR